MRPARRKSPHLPSIGFGLEGVGLAAMRFPRLIGILVFALTIASFFGALQLRFSDDMAALFRTPSPDYQTYQAFTENYSSGGEAAILLVEGDFSDPIQWQAFQALVADLGAIEEAGGVLSVLSIIDLERAAGPPQEDILDLDLSDPDNFENGESEWSPPPLDPKILVAHPMNRSHLLAEDLSHASILIALPGRGSRLDEATALRARVTERLKELPAGMRAMLGGLPIIRAEIIQHLLEEMPILLGCGLVIGFVLGIILLGVLADAVVVLIMPVICMIWNYGAMGALGIPMTPLLNDLPLLVLALAFATAMHLVYAARRDLFAANYDFAALANTIREVGPACILSTFTTMLAFLSFLISGSDAIRQFGLMGAAALCGILITAMIVMPVIIWAALKLGWRPRPPARSSGQMAKGMERGSHLAARGLFRLRWPASLFAALVTLAAAYAHSQVPADIHPLDDVPQGSQTYALTERLEREMGGVFTLVLPLPIELPRDVFDPAAFEGLRKAHEAAEAAFPGHAVNSPWSVIEWLSETGRPLSMPRLDAVMEATPQSLRDGLMSRDGRFPALSVAIGAGPSGEVQAAAMRLEQAVGDALGEGLTGKVTGLTVLAARNGVKVVERLNISLVVAAMGASLLAGLAFRSHAIIALTFIPNILPVLAVGAILYLAGLSLQITSALAMTTALGIAVDDTVHLINRYRHHGQRHAPRLALARAMREVGPVVIVASVVLMAGLAPALFSWSPSIGIFAFFMIVTIGIALLSDLFVLPGLLALRGRSKS